MTIRTTLPKAAVLTGLMAWMLMFGSPDAHAAPKPSSITLIPRIQSVAFDQTGNLVATGVATAVIHGKTYTVPFTAPVTLGTTPNAVDPTCPILDLHLGPIHLNLLGLVVDTSPICVSITAHQGGGLLGDLLCGLANALNGGTLQTFLNGLLATDLQTLLDGITSILDQALQQLNTAVLQSIQAVNSGHTCSILHLEVGPLDLNLLGLEVQLNNCANPPGPVTVDITAVTGPGNLLGNLLCQLLGGNGINLGATLQQILNAILNLLNM